MAAQDLDSAIKTIASRTTKTEFKKIKSVMYGLFAGVDFGFDDSGLAFRNHMDQIYKKTEKDRLAMRGLRVVK